MKTATILRATAALITMTAGTYLLFCGLSDSPRYGLDNPLLWLAVLLATKAAGAALIYASVRIIAADTKLTILWRRLADEPEDTDDTRYYPESF